MIEPSNNDDRVPLWVDRQRKDALKDWAKKNKFSMKTTVEALIKGLVDGYIVIEPVAIKVAADDQE